MKDTGPEAMGWDAVGREKNKAPDRGAMENGQDEVYGHNNNLCVLSRRW